MAAAFLLYCGVLLLCVTRSTAQTTCESIAKDFNQQKEQAVKAIGDNVYFYLGKFSKYRFDLEDYLKKSDYFKTLSDFDIKFQIRLDILGVYEEFESYLFVEKMNVIEYYRRRQALEQKYMRVYTGESGLQVYGGYNRDELLGTQCDPCTDTDVYRSCLQKEMQIIKNVFDNYDRGSASLLAEYDMFFETNGTPLDFVNNARKLYFEFSRNLDQAISVEQVKKAFMSQIQTVYDLFMTIEEYYHTYFQTETFMKGATLIRNTLGYILDRVGPQENQNTSCDYVKAMQDVVDTIDIYLSPHKKSFPMWTLEEFAAIYSKSIVNITNIEELISTLHEAIDKGATAAKKSIPSEYDMRTAREYYNNPHVLKTIDRISVITNMTKNGYCPGISVIRNAEDLAYPVFQCFHKTVPKYRLLYYLYSEAFKSSYEYCYNMITEPLTT